MHRKTILIFSLAIALVAALIAIISQDELRDRLGDTYWILSLAITGCVLLVLAGYAWDSSILKRVKTLRDSARLVQTHEEEADENDPDEIIGLARKIESVEASYRGIVEDQVDMICRYRADGRLTFVNGAYARAFGQKRAELIGQPFPMWNDGAGPVEGVTSFERDMELPDGRRIWINWTQRLNSDQTAGVLEYQAVGHDITDRREPQRRPTAPRRNF
jgi:PAS domain S-box-containing protein